MNDPRRDTSQSSTSRRKLSFDADTHTFDHTSPSMKDGRAFCCHGSGTGGRNLIVCIDGTANQFGLKNINVIELYSLILKDYEHEQLTWYNSGIGTYARPYWMSFTYWSTILTHKIDLAIACFFQRTVLGAYRWLSENYRDGDRIFLFGFSRGAFQVRVLSAMIDKVGLIQKGNEEQIPFAFQLYVDPETSTPTLPPIASEEVQRKPPFFKRYSLKRRFIHLDNKPLEKGESMADRFKNTFSHNDVKVHFVGVWDTVSSIGIMRGKCMLPGTIDGMKHVCFFRHALALDERRVKFLPEYAYGGSATDPKKSNHIHYDGAQGHPIVPTRTKESTTSAISRDPSVTSRDARRLAIDAKNSVMTLDTQANSPPHTLEVWFAGTHSDIGGGNAYNAAMDRSRPPLRWMVFEASDLGLRTKLFDRPLSPKEQIDVKESLTWPWRVLEVLPLRRLTYTREHNGKKTTHKPHLGKPRKIHNGQKIHGSLLRTDRNYTPKAILPKNSTITWEGARKNQSFGEFHAMDLYESTQALVDAFVDSDQSDTSMWEILHRTASSGDGRQAVYEAVIKALQRPIPADVKYQLMTHTMETLANIDRKVTPLKLVHFKDIHASLNDLWNSDDNEWRKTTQKFKQKFVKTGPLFAMKDHGNAVNSVAISPDNKQIISGSFDTTLRVWDSQKGTPIGEPLHGHISHVWSVAISPNGKLLASGSSEKTVRIWDAVTRKPIGMPLDSHTNRVWSVAFSADSKHVASASADKEIRIWDVKEGECVGKPLKGHEDIVTTVAYSPDGKYLASGSDDKTVRIWDARTYQQVGEPIQGHDWVLSVAFSPNSRRIASGSDDGTVCIWEVETRQLVGRPFRGHHGRVWSVAFSPNGRRIVSGSSDGKALVWDAESREIQNIFQHKDHVRAVAFSPDGTFVVSGCVDGVVRVWDAERW